MISKDPGVPYVHNVLTGHLLTATTERVLLAASTCLLYFYVLPSLATLFCYLDNPLASVEL